LFPSDKKSVRSQKNLKTAWQKTLKRAGVPYFRIYDLRSTYATRLSAGGVADEWVTQLFDRRRKGLQEVFADEIADEARGLGENEPPIQMRCRWILAQPRFSKVFWHSFWHSEAKNDD